MNTPPRRNFLHRLFWLGLGSTVLPKWAPAAPSASAVAPCAPATAAATAAAAEAATAAASPITTAKDNCYGIVDLHCHPSLKMFLWGRHLWHRHCPRPGGNPVALQDDIHELTTGHIDGMEGDGFIKGIVCAHYLVEAAAEKDWNTLRIFFPLLKKLVPRLTNKLEHQDWSNFTQINQIIDELENQVHLVNQKQTKREFVIARDFGEFAAAIADDKIPIAHAIEGAHALGRNAPIAANYPRRWRP